ncbi:hypothetical protein HK104_009650 [Borealophlyctis nickersoniae]|nr:hypothetical protein HK104_009650 [Borealophlyctis nickersoniae]
MLPIKVLVTPSVPLTLRGVAPVLVRGFRATPTPSPAGPSPARSSPAAQPQTTPVTPKTEETVVFTATSAETYSDSGHMGDWFEDTSVGLDEPEPLIEAFTSTDPGHPGALFEDTGGEGDGW